MLPPGFKEDPKDEIAGFRRTAPEEDAAESAPRGARRDLGPSSGSETHKRTLRPRHRRVVRQYFDTSTDDRAAE